MKVIAQRQSITILTAIMTSSKVGIPKLRAFNVARNAKKIDNYLWGLKRYFKDFSVEDTKKINHVTLYLVDT